mmetsp:Transcript_37942/g.95961  ORF Transcript_37942/g.95961 Transcript_37942/m.95961 type:complete len:265 (-) Transcript_37942:93-887(-)
MGGVRGSPWYVMKNSSRAWSPMVSTSADTTFRLMSLSTRTMSTSRPGRSVVTICSREAAPLGVSDTSMRVCTTERRAPRGLYSLSAALVAKPADSGKVSIRLLSTVMRISSRRADLTIFSLVSASVMKKVLLLPAFPASLARRMLRFRFFRAVMVSSSSPVRSPYWTDTTVAKGSERLSILTSSCGLPTWAADLATIRCPRGRVRGQDGAKSTIRLLQLAAGPMRARAMVEGVGRTLALASAGEAVNLLVSIIVVYNVINLKQL